MWLSYFILVLISIGNPPLISVPPTLGGNAGGFSAKGFCKGYNN